MVILGILDFDSARIHFIDIIGITDAPARKEQDQYFSEEIRRNKQVSGCLPERRERFVFAGNRVNESRCSVPCVKYFSRQFQRKQRLFDLIGFCNRPDRRLLGICLRHCSNEV